MLLFKYHHFLWKDSFMERNVFVSCAWSNQINGSTGHMNFEFTTDRPITSLKDLQGRLRPNEGVSIVVLYWRYFDEKD